MRHVLLAVIGVGLLLGAYLFFGMAEREVALEGLTGDAERGAYIARLGGCITCHSRPARKIPLSGGAPLETPFGTFYGPNITPDPDAGLGSWTEEDFADALVNGHSRKTGSLYPAFPFTAYGHMEAQDLVDLWAYLQSVEADPTPSSPHTGQPFWLQRVMLRPWRTLFHRPGVFEPDPSRSAAWNRGRYIVEGPGHCVECHTPRNIFGALDHGRHLQGSRLQPSGEKVPALTPDALKKSGYTKSDLMMAFQFGLMPDGDVFGGAMGEVSNDQLQHLDQGDLEALATYLLEGAS